MYLDAGLKLFLALVVQLLDFVHQLVFLHLEITVLFDQVIELGLELVCDAAATASSANKTLFLQKLDLALKLGGDDLDIVL